MMFAIYCLGAFCAFVTAIIEFFASESAEEKLFAVSKDIIIMSLLLLLAFGG